MYQVVGVQMAVHAYVGSAWWEVANHTARAGPEVGKGVLCIDAALDGMPLQAGLHSGGCQCVLQCWQKSCTAAGSSAAQQAGPRCT